MPTEASLHDMDWSDWDADWADADAHAYAEAPGLPVALSAEMIPFDRDGLPLASHLDADDVLHFFAAVDHSLRPDLGDRSAELRYFRAARTDDGRLAHDARPVMPLAHAGDAPFPRPALETMLLDGDLENAQELAWHTAQAHGLAFPAPEDLPPLLEAERRLGIVPAVDPATSALAVEKSWSLPGGEPGVDRLTLAERLRDEPNPYWNTDGDSSQTPEPGSWDELIAQQTPDEPEPAHEARYWQMHTRPAETPEGAPLGTALFVTEFPQLPPDFDDYIDEFGMDDTVYPTEARTLEMAHFASEADARRFAAEFRAVLVPGVLDGPELAPEVAKLEGLSGDWQALDARALADAAHSRVIVRDAADWHLHDPTAEREAQEQVEIYRTGIDL